MTGNDQKKPHHHGNLRAALIDAGIAILREDGLESLTLRKCAAKAGVSHAAPAHHFDGVEGLRIAIADEGFERFRISMISHADQGCQTPRGRLFGICRGYLAFARSEPALYDLMFSFRKNSVLRQDQDTQSSKSYQVLRDTVAPLVPAGTDATVLETQVWSLVHGFAMLVLAGRFGQSSPPDDGVLALLSQIGTDPAP